MNKLLIIAAIVTFTFGYAVYQALKLDNKLSNQSYISSNSVLKEVPDLVLEDYFSGVKHDLRKMASEGNSLVVHFWATWCGPCEVEFPEIVELTEKLKDREDVKFLFITVSDNEVDVKKFLNKYNVGDENNFILLRDDDFHHQKYFGTYKLPETYIFGPSSNLLRKFSGAQNWASEDYVEMLRSL